MDTRLIERRLVETFSNTYRTIWVQYCRLSKNRSEYRAIITLFTLTGTYTMLFSDIINDVDYETMRKIIEENMQGTN
jgi:hypothetical protein